jgi:hypothetical protein
VPSESQGQVHLGQTGTLALRMPSTVRHDIDLVHALREDLQKDPLVLLRRANGTRHDVRGPQDRLNRVKTFKCRNGLGCHRLLVAIHLVPKTAARPPRSGQPSLLECPGNRWASGFSATAMLFTAVAASPKPVAISFTFPGYAATSPAA